VHYLVFNSETYIDGGVLAMTNWMRADLAAVDRSKTPWVVSYSHKLWWMDGTDFNAISGILQDGGVDILYAGHWHCAASASSRLLVRPRLTPRRPLPQTTSATSPTTR